MDNPPKSLAAAKASIASKDAQLIEIEIELDRRNTSIEDLEHKHLKLEQELERVDLQLEDVIAEEDMFVRDVHAKELDILELKKDNKKLTIVRGPGLDVAEESLTSTYAELNDLHSKLQHAKKLCAQLQINEEAVQKLKEKLSKAQANVQEIEEKLIAPEWTVQRLASEISKVELCLGQKERESALLQKNQFSDLVSP
ncbi:unnamed protein product [Sphagnum tenellum]